MVSKLFNDLCSKLGIAHNYTTHYHPMANGEVERTHRTIITRLATSMSESGEEWDNLSSFMMMGYN
ncbi:MAG: transposase family protein, partial [bacterium]|nr:transposase family protein [bacterium]